MDSLKIRSFSKVNFTLDILNKRADGYHNLDSIVQIISLADNLEIKKLNEGIIKVSADKSYIPNGIDNIAYKAAKVFFESTGIKNGVEIYIQKNVPAQAGLGGGSANAGAVLLALNDLFLTKLSKKDLVELAAKVGTDAALFIIGGMVRMRGMGEIIEPLPDIDEMHLIIIKPDFGVSTKLAYECLDRDNKFSKAKSNAFIEALAFNNINNIAEAISNDFDEVISNKHPQIKNIKWDLINSNALNAMLSGSGSAVFGIYENKSDADIAFDLLRKKYNHIYKVKTIGRKNIS